MRILRNSDSFNLVVLVINAVRRRRNIHGESGLVEYIYVTFGGHALIGRCIESKKYTKSKEYLGAGRYREKRNNGQTLHSLAIDCRYGKKQKI